MERNLLEKILKIPNKELTENQYLDHIVSVATPYLLCDHFISDELNPNEKFYYFNVKFNVKANDLLRNKNLNTIKNGQIIQVQNKYLEYFYGEILPFLVLNNLKIVLFTSQSHLNAIKKSKITEQILSSNNILLWISTNPVYENSDKYMAFPYGMHYNQVNLYVNYLKKNNISKNVNIRNLQSSVHKHLPENHIRRQYPIFGVKSGRRLQFGQYLRSISESKYLISTAGDRDDCYRHYECIGLNTIPISNISPLFKSIFEDSMIFSNAEDMISMLENNNTNIEYKPPNRDIITVEYWRNKVNERVSKLNIN